MYTHYIYCYTQNHCSFIHQVVVTLWGKQAEDFDASNNPIVAIKSARIGEFNGGKNLSIGVTSIIEKDPDLPEAHRYCKTLYDKCWPTHIAPTDRSLQRAFNLCKNNTSKGGKQRVAFASRSFINSGNDTIKPRYLVMSHARHIFQITWVVYCRRQVGERQVAVEVGRCRRR